VRCDLTVRFELVGHVLDGADERGDAADAGVDRGDRRAQAARRTSRLDDPVLHGRDVALLSEKRGHTREPLAVLGMGLLEDVVDRRRDRSRLQPVQPVQVVRPLQPLVFGMPLPTADLGNLLGALHERDAPLSHDRRSLALGDVLEPHHGPRRIAAGGDQQLQPARGVILTAGR